MKRNFSYINSLKVLVFKKQKPMRVSILIPTLQMREQRHRKFKPDAQYQGLSDTARLECEQFDSKSHITNH